MEDQVLTIQQMQHLKELGVDTSKASMCWIMQPNSNIYELSVHDEYCYEMSCLNPIPTFTLQDILNIIPEYRYEASGYGDIDRFYLYIDLYNKSLYYADGGAIMHDAFGHNILESAYNMFLWVRMGNIRKEEEK